MKLSTECESELFKGQIMSDPKKLTQTALYADKQLKLSRQKSLIAEVR